MLPSREEPWCRVSNLGETALLVLDRVYSGWATESVGLFSRLLLRVHI